MGPHERGSALSPAHGASLPAKRQHSAGVSARVVPLPPPVSSARTRPGARIRLLQRPRRRPAHPHAACLTPRSGTGPPRPLRCESLFYFCRLCARPPCAPYLSRARLAGPRITLLVRRAPALVHAAPFEMPSGVGCSASDSPVRGPSSRQTPPLPPVSSRRACTAWATPAHPTADRSLVRRASPQTSKGTIQVPGRPRRPPSAHARSNSPNPPPLLTHRDAAARCGT